jgi:creatinine amidohydrolase
MSAQPEVWLRGPVTGVIAELQPVAHSLLQSRAELEHALAGLDVHEAETSPGAAASISFHARHLAGSIDRLLTYARGEQLTEQQRAALAAERKPGGLDGTALLRMVHAAIDHAMDVVRTTDANALNDAREVGGARLPSTVRGLLFHTAEHTLMHGGQIRTTARALQGVRPRPWLVAETTWADIRDNPRRVAVLPWGATEAHNFHLPYGTDIHETAAIAAEAGRIAWEADARVAVLPAVPFGVQTGQLDIPFCVNMNPATQAALLDDIARTLEAQGVDRLVILNGHGGNDFRAIVRELQPRVGVFLCVVNWYACVDPKPFFDEPGDHGGELETSVMLHVAPGLVRPLEDAGDGAARPWKIAGMREGWAWAPRQWTQVSSDTGIGDPAAATPEKGRAYFDAVAARIGGFLAELSAADIADLYE